MVKSIEECGGFMEAKNILDVERFIVECSDMLSGKFFDLRKRLEKFLSVMEQSDDVLDLLADSLDSVDYETEFEKAFYVDKKTGVARAGLPVDDTKKLGLCVSLFNDLVNDKINSNQFLETYFQDKKMTSMQNFLEKVIRPFRDAICKHFGVSENLTVDDLNRHILENEPEEVEEEKEEFPHLDELLAEVVKTSNQILAILKFEKKRTNNLDDLEFVVGAIIQACEKKDLMVINGLVIGLEYVARKFKNVRHLVTDMNNLIYNYYEFLESGAAAQSEEVVDEKTEETEE